MDIVIFCDYSHTVFGKPAGPYRLATELRNNGFSVQVIEYLSKWRPDQLKTAVDMFVGPETLFAGFCNTFFSKSGIQVQTDLTFRGTGWRAGDFYIPDEEAEELIRWIKTKNPKTKIVMGGANALRCESPLIDVFVGGYADYSIVALAKHLRDGSSINLMKLPDGSVFIDSQKDYPVNVFDHEIRFEENDFMDTHTPPSIEIARGCVFKCAYCAFPLNGKKRNEYIRPYNKIRDEFVRNYEKYGITSYIFVDDTYNDAIDKVEGMANMIATLPFELKWSSYARLDIMTTDRNREMPVLMKESGARSITFGVETLHHEAGKKIGKGMHPEKTIEALHWVREIWGDDVQTFVNMIIGLPEEPIDSIYKSYELFMQPDFPIHAFHWNAFIISQTPKFPVKAFTSRVDDNPDGFGYKKDVSSPYWKNDQMDYNEAKKIQNELNENPNTQKRILSCGTRYQNYKMIMAPEEEYWSMSRYDLIRSDYTQRVRNRVQEYITKVLSSNT